MSSQGNDSTKILKKDEKPHTFYMRRGKLVVVSRPDRGKDLLVDKAEIEKTAIIQTLRAHRGNKTQTARDLSIAYSTLHEKIKKYGIR